MSNQTLPAPTLWTGFSSVIRRDVLLAWKRPGDVLNPLFFFAMVSTLFPLAVGPSADQLAFIGPGVVWVAALLATLLSLNSLFMSDFEDGSLEQLVLSPQPLPLLSLAKAVAHWLTTGVPLVLVSPLVAITFQMPAQTIGVMLVTLFLGTISLSLLGSIGAALTVGLNRGTALLSLLILPLAMPVLIFGAAAVDAAIAGFPFRQHLVLLGGMALGALVLCPWAATASLHQALE